MNPAILKTRYRLLPNQRAVTHVVAPAGASQTIQGCVRRPWTMLEIQQFAAGTDTERSAFLLPVINVAGAIPVNGDKLTDSKDSSNWTVKSVGRELEDSFYRCVCVKQK